MISPIWSTPVIVILQGKKNIKKILSIKVEKILKGSLNLIPSPSPSLKIQIMGSKLSRPYFEFSLKVMDRMQAIFINLFYFIWKFQKFQWNFRRKKWKWLIVAKTNWHCTFERTYPKLTQLVQCSRLQAVFPISFKIYYLKIPKILEEKKMEIVDCCQNKLYIWKDLS